MRRNRLRDAGFAVLLLLAATLPFELERPLVPAGSFVLTNVEVALAVVLLLALLAGRPAAAPRLPRRWVILALWFVTAMILSALLAPELRANALKAALRTTGGLLLVPVVLRLASTAHRARRVTVALVIGAAAAVALGLAEQIAGYDFAQLAVFRPGATYAGPFLRLSGPFDYANQAAMFIEATLPFLFALTLEAIRAGRRLSALLGAAVVLLFIQAAILTSSRAGFATLLLVGVLVTALLWRRDGTTRRPALAWAALTGAIGIAVVANWLLSPVFRLRLQSDIDDNWYRAALSVPAELTLRADETRVVPVRIVNTGAVNWHTTGSKPFHLGARWLRGGGQSELQTQPRWPIPRPLAPEEGVVLQVALRAPLRAGAYRLIWDMVHENVTWFDARGDEETSTRVTVVGNAEPAAHAEGGQLSTLTTQPLTFEAAPPGRRFLWQIAFNRIRERPLTGIGLDNYRLTYGRFLDPTATPSAYSQTVHANNWYLEMLASLGVLGAAPFFLWLLVLVAGIFRSLRGRATSPLQVAAAAALLAFLIHGLLDYFLLFNATALQFWLTAGLWLVFNHDNARI